MKKIIYIIIGSFSSILLTSADGPPVHCAWLPWCNSSNPTDFNGVEGIFWKIIWEAIKYVAVLAVIALMISGVMYMLSGWEEEKTKKAKTWIMYSAIAVILSISSWFIVDIINNFKIN